ncbi:HAD family hydrolase [Dactylosporangium cerinum]|uniref:HAD family hydrolase n=1 Tax=Dactylosporangium cerinum TaxID=1434730 RepID=A0ABV9WIM2_9ACTN
MTSRVQPNPIRAVYFDVGETLIDEATEYGTWADWLGVPRHTFSAVFGQVIAQGRDYREVFQHFQPGFDLAAERRRRAETGLAEHFNGRDLYPDVRACLTGLRAAGYFVGVAGNQTARAGRLLHELNLDVDLIATSDDWGAEKPSAAFFDALIASAGCPAAEIVYVGDRLDNDILPARQAGLTTVFIRRGPWGYFYANQSEVEQAHIRIDSLAELPMRLKDIASR